MSRVTVCLVDLRRLARAPACSSHFIIMTQVVFLWRRCSLWLTGREGRFGFRHALVPVELVHGTHGHLGPSGAAVGRRWLSTRPFYACAHVLGPRRTTGLTVTMKLVSDPLGPKRLYL